MFDLDLETILGGADRLQIDDGLPHTAHLDIRRIAADRGWADLVGGERGPFVSG